MMEEKDSIFSGDAILTQENYLSSSPEKTTKSYEATENEENRLLDDAIHSSISDAHHGLFFNEASRIVQIGLEKDLAILEKDKIINDAMETIENLKKDIIHLQVEYEQLDQKYQKEMSYRAEVVKRIDTTRSMIESAAHYSNILATSIKQLEDDKFKIAEFYNEIHQRQEETEEKRKKVDTYIKEQDDMIRKNIIEVTAERDEALEGVHKLKSNLAHIQNNLKCEIDKNLKLELELEKLKNELEDMRTTLIIEKTKRIKSQVVQSHLKKKIVIQTNEERKIWNTRKILNKRKVSLLKNQIKYLQSQLSAAEQAMSNILDLKKNLEKRTQELEKDLLTIRANNTKGLEDLQVKLTSCLNEKEKLYTRCEGLAEEMEKEQTEKNELYKTKENLSNELESAKLILQEKVNELRRLLAENSDTKREAEGLTRELHIKNEIIKDLEAKIQSKNVEQLLEKANLMEDKLEKYRELEEELRNEIFKLNTDAAIERCSNDKAMSEQNTRIRELENELAELKKQNQTIEDNLNKKSSKCIQVENELQLKSFELQEVKFQLDHKIRAESIDRQSYNELMKKLEDLKLRDGEMVQKIKKMEEQNAELERGLRSDLERELSLNKTLTLEVQEKEKSIKKLHEDIENGQKVLISQQEKLDEAEHVILNLKQASQNVMAKEEIINSLKKSLESTEANLEAYKIIVKKLEDEAMKRRDMEEDVTKGCKSEVTQLHQQDKKIENPYGFQQNTPKKNKSESKNDELCRDLKAANKTPSTSRRLLSTPVRLLGTSCPSPNFKLISPIIKNNDPYEFDSDSSTERFNSKQVLKAFKTVQKKGTIQTRRKN